MEQSLLNETDDGITPTPWTIEERPDDKYPDIVEYTILGRNPDAGKENVSYAGDHLVVCRTESRADAYVIKAAPDMFKAIGALLRLGNGEIERPLTERTGWPAVEEMLRAAHAEAKGS